MLVQPGGLWINLGPLLYHWADSHMYLPDDELSIEVSLEDVEHIAAELGFVTERQEMVTAAYAANIRYKTLLCLEMPTLIGCQWFNPRSPALQPMPTSAARGTYIPPDGRQADFPKLCMSKFFSAGCFQPEQFSLGVSQKRLDLRHQQKFSASLALRGALEARREP